MDEIVLLSGRAWQPMAMHYARTFDDCFEPIRRDAVARLVSSSRNVSTVDLGAMPQQKHAHVLGGWKKLPAIEAVVHDRGGSGLVLWHDADTMPHLLGGGSSSIVERARKIAALQPEVDIWLQPGRGLLDQTPSRFWTSFEGVVKRRVSRARCGCKGRWRCRRASSSYARRAARC